MKKEEAKEIVDSAIATIDRLTTDVKNLRRLLWLSHGCLGLYGDDGEMQCGHCLIDFKRDTVEQIEKRLVERGKRK